MNIIAKDILKISPLSLDYKLPKKFTLVFDNGNIESTDKELIYSSYCWELHKTYPNTPLLKEHHLSFYIKPRFGTSSTLKLLGQIAWDTVSAFAPNEINVSKVDLVARQISKICNNIYNIFSVGTLNNVSSLDVVDYIYLMSVSEIAEANKNVKATPKSIEDTYASMVDCLKNNNSINHNVLVKAHKSKLIKEAQLLQCIGPRGYLVDLDGKIFYKPILVGYIKGITKFYDILIESRASAVALAASKDDLQESEYSSRRLQLVSSTLKNIHIGDCGSKVFSKWQVRGNEYDDDGLLIRQSDLPNLKGKYYKLPNNQLGVITGNEDYLIGSTIEIRSPIHCCHPDPYGVCSVCVNEGSILLPELTNIGHYCVAVMKQIISQSILGTKHIMLSSKASSVTLTPFEKQFISTNKEGTLFFVNKNVKGKITLSINSEFVYGLSDIFSVENIKDLTLSRLSAIAHFSLIVEHANITNEVQINSTLNKTKASLTYEFLEYIKQHKWKITENKFYLIELDKLDRSIPILSIPPKEYSMSDHSDNINKLIESSVKLIEERDVLTNPVATVVELFDLVNKKLNINLSLLEIIIKSNMIISAKDNNYYIPKPWTDQGLGVAKLTIGNRSLSVALAFEEQVGLINKPLTYLLTDRPDNPMDYVFDPNLKQ